MKFNDVETGYANLWAKAQINLPARIAVFAAARRIGLLRPRYEDVSARTGVPWWWIAITHHMESGGNFNTHLHNGDPLSARTVHVPSGRPAAGEPPFTWEASAEDALRMKGLNLIRDWTVPRGLYEFERYNGFGYVAKRVNSPYLWSRTTLYTAGKYVSDGVFDANAVSSQIGAAALLKALEAMDILNPKRTGMSDLIDALKPFERLIPTVVLALAGANPLAALAIRGLAEAFDVTRDNPDTVPEALVTKMNAAAITQLVAALSVAEQTLVGMGLTGVGAHPPVLVPAPSGAPVPGKIDLLTGSWFTGYKTIIGIVIYGGAWIAGALGYLPPDMVSAIQGFGVTVGGIGLVAKLDRWLPWLGLLLKK